MGTISARMFQRRPAINAKPNGSSSNADPPNFSQGNLHFITFSLLANNKYIYTVLWEKNEE